MKKIILFFLVLGAGAYLYTAQKPNSTTAPNPSPAPTITETILVDTAPQIILTATASGQTALELLSADTKFETKDYGDAGMFVTRINDLSSDNEHYWAFYVNDEYAQQGISQTVLESDDVIKFVYEEIDPTKF